MGSADVDAVCKNKQLLFQSRFWRFSTSIHNLATARPHSLRPQHNHNATFAAHTAHTSTMADEQVTAALSTMSLSEREPPTGRLNFPLPRELRDQ